MKKRSGSAATTPSRDDHLAEARAELDPETCDEIWKKGLALTMEDAVQLAMQDD